MPKVFHQQFWEKTEGLFIKATAEVDPAGAVNTFSARAQICKISTELHNRLNLIRSNMKSCSYTQKTSYLCAEFERNA